MASFSPPESSAEVAMLDLFVLTADKNMLHAVRGVLNRPQALGISSIRSKILPHPNRDGGVRTTERTCWQGRRARPGMAYSFSIMRGVVPMNRRLRWRRVWTNN